MGFQLNPGPLFNDPLYLGDQHRTYDLFNHGLVDEKSFHVRRSDQKLWQYLKDNRITHCVKQLFRQCRFCWGC
jgi:hypothetical protein